MGRPKGGINRYYSKEDKLEIVKEVEQGQSAIVTSRKRGKKKGGIYRQRNEAMVFFDHR